MTEPTTRSFSTSELRCKCKQCNGNVPNKCDVDALAALQRIRDSVGFPIYLNSAYRCEHHPAESKKDRPGQHFKGCAFDISISPGSKRMAILDAAFDAGVRGVGWSESFLHLDWRSGPKTCWSYK